MEGLEKLRTSLNERTEAEVKAVLDAARAEADRLLAEAGAEAEELEKTAQNEEMALKEAEDRRNDALAALEERRLDLDARQSLISDVLSEAGRALETLPEPERRRYYARLLTQHDELDTVVLYGREDSELIKELAAELHDPHELRLNPGQSAGLIFINGRVRDDCSFRTALRTRHDELLATVAGILFPESRPQDAEG